MAAAPSTAVSSVGKKRVKKNGGQMAVPWASSCALLGGGLPGLLAMSLAKLRNSLHHADRDLHPGELLLIGFSQTEP